MVRINNNRSCTRIPLFVTPVVAKLQLWRQGDDEQWVFTEGVGGECCSKHTQIALFETAVETKAAVVMLCRDLAMV